MEQRERLNLEVASDFVTMAAHLVYIKTRMLLSIDDEEAMSEMEQLMAALEEHQSRESYLKIKSVTPALGRRYEYGRDYITKVPEPVRTDKTYRYVHDKEDLLSAMNSVLERADEHLPPAAQAFEGIVGREPYPVSDKARSIIERLVQFGVTRFRALFRQSRSRSEVVATFLAILELCKANRVHLAGTAEDCTVTCTGQELDEELDVTVDTY
jgi:segregation and condensation protein A